MGSSDHSDARAVVRRGPARSIHRVGPASIALLAVALLAFVSGGSASGGFGAGAGGTGRFSSATHVVSDTVGGVTCRSSPDTAAGITSNSANCDAPLTSGPAATSTISLANQGSKATGTARLTTSECAVQAFADSSTAGRQPAVVTGGVTYRTAGPPSLAGSFSATFDGTSGHLASARQVNLSSTALSVSAWFRTSTPNAMILGATSSQAAVAASSFDRMLWLDANGRLVAGVFTGARSTITSGSTTAANYADGAWHHLVMTVGRATATTSSFQLYVDGARVAGTVGNVSAYPPIVAYDGFWHLGYGYANTWANQPASWFFRGSLANVAVFASELSAAQIVTLRDATTQSAEAAAISALSPTSSWLLQDESSSTFAGPIHSVPPNGVTRTFRDASGNANSGTAQGTLTQDTLGPPTGGGAVSFDGSSGYISTATQLAGPSSVSISFWFRAALPFSGSSILGFAAGQLTSVNGYDRMFYLDSGGRLYFAVYPNGYRYLSSPASLADGSWHFAVGTAAATSATTGTMKLYVDGQLVAGTDNNLTGLTNSQAAQAYSGWWHLGWEATSTWPGSAGYYFKGSLADVAVFDTGLNAAQVTTLYTRATRAAYAAAVTGGVATAKYFWPLDDVDAASPPCTYLAYSVSQAGRCLLPASAGACAVAATRPVGTVTLDVPVTDITATTRRLGTLPSIATGMHAVIPWRIETTGGGFTSTLVHDRGFVTL